MVYLPWNEFYNFRLPSIDDLARNQIFHSIGIFHFIRSHRAAIAPKNPAEVEAQPERKKKKLKFNE